VIAKVRSGSGKAYWYQHFQQVPKLAEAMIPGNEAAWIGSFVSGVVGEIPADAVAEYVRMYSIAGTPGAGANYYRTFGEDAKRWARFAGHWVAMSIFYVYGKEDKVIID